MVSQKHLNNENNMELNARFSFVLLWARCRNLSVFILIIVEWEYARLRSATNTYLIDGELRTTIQNA